MVKADLFVSNPAPSDVPLAALRLHPSDEADLLWYFTCADQQSTGIRSALGAMQDWIGSSGNAPTSSTYIIAAHERISAGHRSDVIRRRLARLSALHQRVLEAHYGSLEAEDVRDDKGKVVKTNRFFGRQEARKAFGEYAGVAACTEAYRKQGRGRPTSLETLSAQSQSEKNLGEQADKDRAEAKALVRKILAEATVLLSEASAAYRSLSRGGRLPLNTCHKLPADKGRHDLRIGAGLAYRACHNRTELPQRFALTICEGSVNLKTAYSLSEVASILGRTINSTRRLADRGTLPTMKIGSKRYVTLATLQALDPTLWESVLLRERMALAASTKAPGLSD